MSAPLESVVRASARHQVALHRVTGGAWLALGALLLVLVVRSACSCNKDEKKQ